MVLARTNPPFDAMESQTSLHNVINRAIGMEHINRLLTVLQRLGRFISQAIAAYQHEVLFLETNQQP